MRVNPIQSYNSIQQSTRTENKNQKLSAEAYPDRQKDQVTISDEARHLSVALQRSKETADIREDKVRELQIKIQNGTYSVSSSVVAEHMLRNAGVWKK